MAGYIVERKDKLLTMQDGKDAKGSMPILEFIDNCNKSADLLDPNLPFLSFVTNAYETKEDFNRYLLIASKLNAQFGDFFLQMKRRCLPVVIPDATYWNGEYEKITRAIDDGKMTKIDGCTRLAKEFVGTMNYCIEKNKETAKPYGIIPPKSELEKKNEKNNTK